MGVLGLWEVLESVGHPIKVEGLEGKILGVDANIWLYKFIRGFREKDNASNIESHKLGLFNRICKLLFYRIKPVFVFDGPAPVLKRRTLERRQNTRNKQLTKVQDAAMRLLATQLKSQYPDADIDHLRITLPNLQSNNLVAAEKLTDEDRDLFYLPDTGKLKNSDDDESDSAASYDDDVQFTAAKVDINSEDFEALPAETRYEILQDIKASRRKIRNYNNLPEDANSFSNLQLERLKARRKVQEKIEKAEKEICTNYTGELADGSSIQAFRVQSDATATILYRNNTYDPKALETYKTEEKSASHVKVEEELEKTSTLKEYAPDENENEDDDDSSEGGEDHDERSSEIAWEEVNWPNAAGQQLSERQEVEEQNSPPLAEKVHGPTSESPTAHSITQAHGEYHEESIFEPSPSQQPTYVAQSQATQRGTHQNDHEQEQPTTRQAAQTSESAAAQQTSPAEPQADQDPDLSTSSPVLTPEPVAPTATSQVGTTQVLGSGQFENVESGQLHKHVGQHQPQHQQSQPSEQAKTAQPIANPFTNWQQLFEAPAELSSNSQHQAQPSEDPFASDERTYEQPASNYGATSSGSAANGGGHAERYQDGESHVSSAMAAAQRSTNRVTNKVVQDAKELLRLFGIPYLDAAGEAEAQCAKLEELKLTEGTITDDSDIWLFGSQNVFRYFFSDDKYVMQYKMTDIEFHVRMTRENLACFAMLVGSDYTDGIMNVGPVTALEILSEFPGEGIEPLIKFREWHRAASRDKTALGNKNRKKLLKFRVPDEFPSRAVYEAYLRPIADTSAEQFCWGVPELDELREYARRNFGWDPKKVDDKLLPVMKKLNEKKLQRTIDTFFFKTQANRNPEMFRSKRVNQALNKIAKRGKRCKDEVEKERRPRRASKAAPPPPPPAPRPAVPEVINLSEDDSD